MFSAIGSATAAPASPAANVTSPITMALAASTRPRRGLAANVVRITPRRYSAVMNSAPRAITASRPASEPFSTVPSGSTSVTYGAMSPLPARVNVPPDFLKPPVGVLGQKWPSEGAQINGMPVGKPIWPPRHAPLGRSPLRLTWSKAAVARVV